MTAEVVEVPDDLERRAAELAVEKLEALSDDWRDTIIVRAIASGVQAKFHELLRRIGNGEARNTKWNQGYMQALRDLHAQLLYIAEPQAPEETDESEETND